MAEKEADLLVDEEDQATDAPELAIAQRSARWALMWARFSMS